VVALAALLIAWWRIPPAVPVVESFTQLTDDGEPKEGGFANDVSRIYFNEGTAGSRKIVQVSISGGPTAPVETRLANPFVVDVAQDGSALLVGVGDINTSSNSLWSIPLPAGEPNLLARGRLQDAGVFPDGRIVFAKGNDSSGADFFTADKDGSNSHKLISVPGSVYYVQVSPGGKKILFWEHRKGTDLLHEMAADGTGVREIMKGSQLEGKRGFAWSPDEKYLVYRSSIGKQTDIWALPMQTGLLRRSPEPIQLTAGPLSYSHVLLNRVGKQIFTVAAKERGELVRYDIKSHQFLPLLSGISATDVTFSRDGKWVAYASYPDHILWRSRSDGTERMQLTYAPMNVHFPYISPDGTRVAFFTDKEEVFVINMEGGQPQKVDEKGSFPTWSPDGNYLFYRDHPGSQNAQIADVRTGKKSVVQPGPGWGGVWATQDTLVFLNHDLTKLVTFNLKSPKWTDLVSGNVHNFMPSPDGKYLYFTTEGVEPKALRLRFADHQIETITSLKEFHRAVNNGDTQINVAPDGSPVFTRDTGSQEIYALNVRWP
jgi:Tol biopolymer transport system component